MAPGSLPPADLFPRITQLYFRVAVPLLAAVVLLTMLTPTLQLNGAVLGFVGLLLLSAALHPFLPPRWEWGLRLVVAGAQVGFVLLTAAFGRSMGITGGSQALSIVLLTAPVTVLTWSLLFADHPRTGRAFCLALSLAATLLVHSWNRNEASFQPGTAPLLLLVCLGATLFGWTVARLQRRALRGERHARRDALTGLLNRRAFEEVQGAAGGSGVLAVLDIDHFKRVNDGHGHEAGDRVLRAVADVLLDTVGECGEVYRWGGEEFVVHLPGRRAADALPLLERVRGEVASRAFVADQHVTLSAGLGTYGPDRGRRAAFAHADAALRRAKNGGRNRVVVAEEAQASSSVPSSSS